MLEQLIVANKAVNAFVWGLPAVGAIVGIGLLLTFRTGVVQFREFAAAMRETLGKVFVRQNAKAGAISPFHAVCTAFAGTIGTGNIAGVAGAVAIGGPGAVFWMWCSALLGATIDLGVVWDVSESFNGLMVVPNLIALLLLSGKLVETMKGRGTK